MNEFLDNEEYTIKDRLEAAKMIIEIRDKYIEELTSQLDRERSNKAWAAEEEGFQRMGL
jgi:hypothetical protein